jgi:hypothetical protein
MQLPQCIRAVPFRCSGVPRPRLGYHALNEFLDELGFITRKLEGSEVSPFVHILQYKEEELVQQLVVCRCSEEG